MVKSYDKNKLVKIVEFKRSTNFIFTEEYCEMNFRKDSSNIFKNYFTPELKDVEYINNNLAKQYLEIFTKGIKAEKFYEPFINDVKKEAKQSVNFDKQFFGYVNNNDEKIILIQQFNFEYDPYNFKTKLDQDFINCFLGWCSVSVRRIKFNVEKSTFSIH
ncbi:hypothetical protein GCM10011343_03150 [Flavobacterium orientale]|uniref:Uncharacterized protein n=2 Tax=Flavobacterium orientale TaxID=1756020 RepID=A0A917D9Y4_9FLAO|nr:hypothetical protein GCM10011343_03150 [Flavobacterium orientale]